MYQPYTLQKRPTTKPKKFIYYCQFRDTHGKRMTAISTGKTNKAEAREWAQERLERGLICRKADQRFSDYTQHWFDWEKSPYIKRKRQRNGTLQDLTEEQEERLIAILESEETDPKHRGIESIIERLRRRMSTNSGNKQQRNAAFEVHKVLVRILRKDSRYTNIPGFEKDGTPEEPSIYLLRFESAIIKFFVDVAYRVSDQLTDAQLDKVEMYRLLARVYMLDAAMLRRNLSIEA